MTARSDSAKIIALIGIDGSGKSSTLEVLRRDPGLTKVRFVRKEKRHGVDSILRAFGEPEGVQNDYLYGPFAAAIRWALAFDFLRFYEEEVAPLLGTVGCVVSDRWSVCSMAYAAVGPDLDSKIEAALACVPPADLLIYLEVDPREAMRRITASRTPYGDETIELLEAFRDGYEKILRRVSSEVVRIATEDLTTTVQKVVCHIESGFSSR
jgi:thymidylate kinase